MYLMEDSESQGKKLDVNYTIMLRTVENKSWKQHPTKQQSYGHLPFISQTLQIRRTRNAELCGRSKDELISDVLLWSPVHVCTGVGRPEKTYINSVWTLDVV